LNASINGYVGVKSLLVILRYNMSSVIVERKRQMLANGPIKTEMKLTTPQFYCPNCHDHRSYKIKATSEVELICVIPLYHAGETSRVVQCQVCKNGFDSAIFHPSNKFLFKLVAAARSQLLTGTCPGSLKVKLMSDGLIEEFIDKLISLAQ
jgi:hypothetical protein